MLRLTETRCSRLPSSVARAWMPFNHWARPRGVKTPATSFGAPVAGSSAKRPLIHVNSAIRNRRSLICALGWLDRQGPVPEAECESL